MNKTLYLIDEFLVVVLFPASDEFHDELVAVVGLLLNLLDVDEVVIVDL